MEKYTKRQRLSIYKIALQVMREEIDNDCVGGTGFCFLLDVATEFCNLSDVLYV